MKITEEIKISDNGFVFNSKTGDSFQLNPVGLELIKQIATGKDIDEIKSLFIQNYDVEELTFERDFYEFCALLKHHHLTSESNPADFV